MSARRGGEVARTTGGAPGGGTPAFSARFRRAARAERDRLAARLGSARRTARDREGALAAAEAEVEGLEARLAALGSLLGEPAPEPVQRLAGLRGRAIREAGVAILLGRGVEAGPIHYRDWLALVEERAGPVAGLRPEAVFLAQVTRHPLVRATTRRGLYELDREAVGRLEARVARLRATLVAEAVPDRRGRGGPGGPALELGRAERSLREARDALPSPTAEGSR